MSSDCASSFARSRISGRSARSTGDCVTTRGVRKFGHGRICREILLRGGQAQPTGSARETTFRSQRPLHQVPLTFQPATNGDPIASARDVHAGRTGASKEFTLSQSSCAVALFRVVRPLNPSRPQALWAARLELGGVSVGGSRRAA